LGFGASNIYGSNNLWFGNGPGPTSGFTNNVNADPLFVNLSLRDFHLLSTSPAIDAGIVTPATRDHDGIARPQGASYDLGAYELPMAPAGGVRGDLNGDGLVTLADLRLLIQMLVGQVPPDLGNADLTQDGQLTLADVRALIQILVSP
jgi:hypothetical protein